MSLYLQQTCLLFLQACFVFFQVRQPKLQLYFVFDWGVQIQAIYWKNHQHWRWPPNDSYSSVRSRWAASDTKAVLISSLLVEQLTSKWTERTSFRFESQLTGRPATSKSVTFRKPGGISFPLSLPPSSWHLLSVQWTADARGSSQVAEVHRPGHMEVIEGEIYEGAPGPNLLFKH